MEDEGKKLSWKTILWAIAVPVAAIAIAVLVGVAMIGFQWNVVGEVFKSHWILFLSVFGMVLVLMLLMARYAIKVMVIGLLAIAVLFILSAGKGNEVTTNIRAFISSNFEVSFLLGGIAITSFAVAIAKIGDKEKD